MTENCNQTSSIRICADLVMRECFCIVLLPSGIVSFFKLHFNFCDTELKPPMAQPILLNHPTDRIVFLFQAQHSHTKCLIQFHLDFHTYYIKRTSVSRFRLSHCLSLVPCYGNYILWLYFQYDWVLIFITHSLHLDSFWNRGEVNSKRAY